MNTLYPIAKLGYRVLIVNKSDLPFVGKERGNEVRCTKINLRDGIIDDLPLIEDDLPLIELENHFKFNPWEKIIDEEERDAVLREIKSIFSDKDISEKIVGPLAAHVIKHAP